MNPHPANREAVAQDLMLQEGDSVLTVFAKKESAKTTPQNILSISSLSLHQFRNHAASRLEISSEPVILTGHNGAGKTNILEALSLLTPGRGLRRARLSEITSFSPTTSHHPPSTHYWAIAAHINGMQGEAQIGIGLDPESASGEKRLLKIDGKIVRSQAELARHMAMVWLTPQMDQLFNDGASAGRKFLDRLVYGFDAEHASRTNEYEFAMRERNRLLSQPPYDAAWLDALEQTMAETGAAIATARLETTVRLNRAIMASNLSFPKAHLSVFGLLEDKLAGNESLPVAEEAFKAALRQARAQDGAAGRALCGPHRSELWVTHQEKGLPAQACSTGEQKAVLLSIILAQARASAAEKALVPVVLLDEVIAHLDMHRKLELFEEICQIGAQVWMTGTDAKMFGELQEKAQFLKVENGSISHG